MRWLVLLVVFAGCGPRSGAITPGGETAEGQSEPTEPTSTQATEQPDCESFDSLVALCASADIPAEECEPISRVGSAGGVDEAAVVGFTYYGEDEDEGTSTSVVMAALRVGSRWFVGAHASGYELGGTDNEYRSMRVEVGAGGLLVITEATSTDDGQYSESSTTTIVVRAVDGVPYVRHEAVTGAGWMDPYNCPNVDERECEECADRCGDDRECRSECLAECECETEASYTLPIAFEDADRLRVGPTEESGGGVGGEGESALPIYPNARTIELPRCSEGECEPACAHPD